MSMYCPNCDSEVESVVRDMSETYPVKGEEVTISAHVRICCCCGEQMWDEELDSKNLQMAFSIYRQRHNLLQPVEIRMIREKYGLSQVAFARILGFGDKTIARYENGSIPDAAQNNLIDLIQHPSNFEELLEKNKEKISEQDYLNARASLDLLRPKILYKPVPTTSNPAIYSTQSSANISYYTSQKYWRDLNYA